MLEKYTERLGNPQAAYCCEHDHPIVGNPEVAQKRVSRLLKRVRLSLDTPLKFIAITDGSDTHDRQLLIDMPDRWDLLGQSRPGRYPCEFRRLQHLHYFRARQPGVIAITFHQPSRY
jgi:hypothetical protein